MLQKKYIFLFFIIGIIPVISISIDFPWALDYNDNEKNMPNLDSPKFAKLQIPFIENRGQLDEQVKFYADTFAGTIFVTDKNLTYHSVIQTNNHAESIVISEKFINGTQVPVGVDKSETIINYFKGEEKNWRTHIPSYNTLSLGSIWENVDVTLNAYQNNVEKIFTVYPDGDPSDIKLEFTGISKIGIDEFEQLVLDTESGSTKFSKPIAYQNIDGQKIAISVNYIVDGNSYGFDVGTYDKNFSLVIDPLLASTFLGGTGDEDESSIAIDNNGDVFVITETESTDFPSPTGTFYDESFNGGFEDFVIAKFNSSLTTLIAATYVGGSGDEDGSSIAIDSNGNVFVAGISESTDFPSPTGTFYDESHNGGDDVIVFKLNTGLTSLLASTYLGGSVTEEAVEIAIDSSDNIFISTTTDSTTDFPTTSGAYDESHNGSDDAAISKLNNDLTILTASTFLGGTGDEDFSSIAIDSNGNVFFTVTTASSDFPTTSGAYDTSYSAVDNDDLIVAKLDNSLSSLLASTFLEGTDDSDYPRIALDNSNNVFVLTATESSDFPVTSGAYSTTFQGGGSSATDFAVAKLDSSLSTLLAATFLGGNDSEELGHIAIDSAGNVFVLGETISSNISFAGTAYDTTYSAGGGEDFVIFKLNNALTSLLSGTYLGGGNDGDIIESGNALALDAGNNVYVTGASRSSYPVTTGAYDESFNGGGDDTVVSKLDCELLSAGAICPSVVIGSPSATSGSTLNSDTLHYTVTFSSTVTDFVIGDITVSGTAHGGSPSATNFAGSGTYYTFDVIRGSSDGTVVVSIADGTASKNSVSNTYTLTIDTTNVSVPTGITSITSTATVTDDATFSELDDARGITTVTIGSSTYALVSGSNDDGVQIIDISTPASPTAVASGTIIDGATFSELDYPSGITTVKISNANNEEQTFALVAADINNGVQIINMTSPASPTAVASGTIIDGATFSELDSPRNIATAVIGDITYALVASFDDNGVQIIDISTPASPTAVASGTIIDGTNGFSELGGSRDIAIVTIGSKTYALVAAFTDNGVQIIDISTPASPTAVASGTIIDGTNGFSELEGPNSITTTVIGSNTYALVASGTNNGVQIIDISTPASPTAVASGTIIDGTNGFSELNNPFGIATESVGGKTYALVASQSDDGVQIIDITNPVSPTAPFARTEDTGSFTELDNAVAVTTATIGGKTYALVASFVDDGVQIFSLDVPVSGAGAGEFVQVLNDRDGLGGSFSAFDLGVNSTDHIFVADRSGTDSIRKYDSSGIFLSSITSGINSPHDVVHDSNDRIIVTNDGTGGKNVKIFNSDGSSGTPPTLDGSEAGATPFVFPHSVAVDSDDNIYIVDRDAGTSGILQKYNSAGVFQFSLDGSSTGGTAFNEPLGVAVDSQGRIIVTQREGFDGFQIFNSTGIFTGKVEVASPTGTTTFDNPHDVAVDSHLRIYVADQGNSRVQIFDASGAFEKSITTGSSALVSPSGVAIDSAGRILVYDSGSTPQRIEIFQGLGAPVFETIVAASVLSDSSESTQEIAEAAAAEPDETFLLPEEQYEEVVAESLATPISAPVEVIVEESFEAVSAPEKVEAAPEDTSFKVLAKVLSKSKDKEDDAKKLGLEYKDGDVRALVILDDNTSDSVINEIKKYANIESANKGLVQINIPIDDLSTLYKIPDIAKVQPTSKAIQSVMTSQGYKTIHANIPHELGVKGDGIKIAILDLAFDDSNDEIKNNIVETKTFRHDFDGYKIPLEGFGTESVHGTAVSEIVIDISPNSELYLYTFASEVEFLDAMDYAMDKDVDLITMSAGWVNYPTDGTSEMTKKVEQAIDVGIPFVVSAGNYAETHWEGNFIDSNGNGWHEFAGTDEGISVMASEERVDIQIPFILYLMWSSPSGEIYDFDLSLTDEDGAEVSYSANLQETDNAILFEYVYFTPEKAGTYSLGVRYGGDDPPDAILEIFSPSDKLEYQVPEGSVSVPTDARGIISVGAINYYDSRLEPFSSQGPTNNCIASPSLVAPDAVTTTAYGDSPFFGTSAAAPHVAGMVALMIDKTPQLTPSQILSELTTFSDTEFVSYVNLSNMFGAGAADSKFIAELDEIVTPVILEDGCIIGELQKGNRVGESIVQEVVPEIIKTPIPQWIKSNAGWWADGTVTDETFVNALEFLIEQEIIDMPKTVNVSEAPKDKTKHEFDVVEEIIPIPDWIKSNAGWWSEGIISNETFIQSIEYLIKQKIIDVN